MVHVQAKLYLKYSRSSSQVFQLQWKVKQKEDDCSYYASVPGPCIGLGFTRSVAQFESSRKKGWSSEAIICPRSYVLKVNV